MYVQMYCYTYIRTYVLSGHIIAYVHGYRTFDFVLQLQRVLANLAIDEEVGHQAASNTECMELLTKVVGEVVHIHLYRHTYVSYKCVYIEYVCMCTYSYKGILMLLSS